MSLLKRLQASTIQDEIEPENIPARDAAINRRQHIANTIHREAVKEIGYELLDSRKEDGKMQEIRRQVDKIADQVLEKDSEFFTSSNREEIIKKVMDEILGYGPITPLLEDPTISEVMVNGPYQIYVESRGKIRKDPATFRDNDHLFNIIERILSPLGRRIDERNPMVDARLPDGSRVNAIIPPLALNGCVLTIRKFSSQLLTIDDLIHNNTLNQGMAKFLEACVKGRLNIIVSGGTGAGKTSTLNIISSFIPESERIITIEDSAELDLKQEHVISLETRPSNTDNSGEVTIRDLVRNSLRMRPDRLVVGEVRGGEALDMLQAMNTGHDGSLTTGHSNSPRDMLSRLETMVLMAGIDLPIRAIREQIASAIGIIVHQSRMQDGSRKITHITEVLGMEGEVITLQDIFVFEKRGLDGNGKVSGSHRATGLSPHCLDRLKAMGITILDEYFYN